MLDGSCAEIQFCHVIFDEVRNPIMAEADIKLGIRENVQMAVSSANQ